MLRHFHAVLDSCEVRQQPFEALRAVDGSGASLRPNATRPPGVRFAMLYVPRRHAHYLYGVIQAGITCGVATLIAHLSFMQGSDASAGLFLSWLLSWLTMVPIVLLSAPLIRRAVNRLTVDDQGRSEGY